MTSDEVVESKTRFAELPEDLKQAILAKADMITGMLQGTMGLEGQGLDEESLRKLNEMTIKDLVFDDIDEIEVETEGKTIRYVAWEHIDRKLSL